MPNNIISKICIACKKRKTIVKKNGDINFGIRSDNGNYRNTCKICQSAQTKAKVEVAKKATKKSKK